MPARKETQPPAAPARFTVKTPKRRKVKPPAQHFKFTALATRPTPSLNRTPAMDPGGEQ